MNFTLNGLYVITDKKLISRDIFISSVESAICGGAKIVQLREKDSSENEIIEIGKKLLKVTKKYKIPLIINDYPEIVKKIDADGVHLGHNDCSVESAREILGKDKIIGVSCYGELERGKRAMKEGANYLAFGTPYDTPTKPGRKPTPIEVLSEARTLFDDIPIFAIGGINTDNAEEILATGVDGIAVITSLFGSKNPEESAKKLSSLFK